MYMGHTSRIGDPATGGTIECLIVAFKARESGLYARPQVARDRRRTLCVLRGSRATENAADGLLSLAALN